MAVGGWVELHQSQQHPISIADLNYSDADNDPIASLTVQTLPNLGELQLYGYPVYAGQEVSAADIQFGYFSYQPTSNVAASYNASLTFSVSDGVHTFAATTSLGFQVTVTPNSPPTVSGSNHLLGETQIHTLDFASWGYSDAENDSLQSITPHGTATYNFLV